MLKGPTAAFMAFAALECNADGVADFYGELLDGIVADENVARAAHAADRHAHGRPARSARASPGETLDFAGRSPV